MKRKLASIASAVLAMMLLGTACASTTTSSGSSSGTASGEEPAAFSLDGRVITFGANWDIEPEAGSSRSDDLMIARVDEIEKKYDCKIEYLYGGDYEASVVATTLSGEPNIDFGWFPPQFMFANAASNVLYPLSDISTLDLSADNVLTTTTQYCTYKDKIYGVDFGTYFDYAQQNNCLFMFYNKTLLKKHGQPDPFELQSQGKWTWEAMRNIAIATTADTDGDGQVDQWGLADMNNDIAHSLVLSNDANFYERSTDGASSYFTYSLTSSKALEALNYYQQLACTDKVLYVPPAGSAEDAGKQLFIDGKAAFFEHNAWVNDEFHTSMKDEYGVVMFPKRDESADYATHQIWLNFLGIPSSVKDPEKVAVIMYELLGVPIEDPLTEGMTPEELITTDWESRCNDPSGVQTLLLANTKPIIMDYSWVFSEAYNTNNNAIIEIANGTQTPTAAITAVAPQIQAIIDSVLKS